MTPTAFSDCMPTVPRPASRFSPRWLAAALVCCSLALPLLARAERIHRYTVTLNAPMTELAVHACFDGRPPPELVAESLDASLALTDARVDGGREPIEPSGSLSLKTLSDNGCLAYRVDVSRPYMVHDRSGPKVRRIGRDLVAAVGLWLWRPETLAEDEDVELVFALPPGIAISAPWAPVAGAPLPTFRLGRSPYQWPASVAFGPFTERVLNVAGAQLRLVALDGTPAVDEAGMADWISDAARMVASVYGRFPDPQIQVLIVPNARGNEPTPWAYVARGGAPAVHLFINQRRPLHEFFDDWTATHELSHLLLPFIDQDDAWLSEGVATYYQNVLRARAGKLTPQQAWTRMNAGFLRGRSEVPDMTLAQATENMYRGSTYMRVYWEGAAIVLLADTRLRQLTGGKQSMDTALAALHDCCLQTDKLWSARALLDKLDELTGTRVFSELYATHVGSREFPDLSATYRALGLGAGADGIVLTADAPQAALRDGIMRGDAIVNDRPQP